MTFEMPDFSLALPEIWVMFMACVVLVVDLFARGRESAPAFYLTQATLLIAAWLALDTQWGIEAVTFNGTYVADSLAAVLKVTVCLLAFVSFAYGRDYLRQRDLLRGEFFLIGLISVLGMLVMASAHNMLSLYLGLELLSLSLYAMVAFDRDSRSGSEAAMKYFVLGALSSGMLLYGMSMIYGGSASLDFAKIAQVAANGNGGLLLGFGIAFSIVGVAFKFGAVPFHMWIPDVYEGAPTATTLFVSTAPKVAAVALFVRLLVDGLGALAPEWHVMAAILAVGSLAVGNLFALVQTNIKRLLGYSTISHIGFLFLGFVAAGPDGYTAALFYAITYGIMAAGAFGMVILLSRRGFEADRIEDMKGLNERHSGFAFVMLVLMFSMTGIPGTVGFYAKWLVLKAVIDAGMVWLAVVAVIFAVIGAFYYLRVLKMVYFDRLEEDAVPLQAPAGMRYILAANGALIVILGLFPDSLIAVCRAAFGG
ncbi:MAG TPA: NADH-quinone oxidoreductase subunit NuoN [Gammaproteobacteria bacterium]|nr:NADH-quinone oxidoreductase subunit NuoN [Gammaproteobacteria bacterium]